MIDNRKHKLLQEIDQNFTDYIDIIVKEQYQLKKNVESYFSAVKSKATIESLRPYFAALNVSVSPNSPLLFESADVSLQTARLQWEEWCKLENI